MYKRIAVFAFVIIISFSFTTLILAQDNQKDLKKDNKMELTKGDKEMGPVKSISCGTECGFMVKSRNETEIVHITKKHVREMHHKKLTDKEVKEIIKTE